jgi:hypothetical protein
VVDARCLWWFRESAAFVQGSVMTEVGRGRLEPHLFVAMGEDVGASLSSHAVSPADPLHLVRCAADGVRRCHGSALVRPTAAAP